MKKISFLLLAIAMILSLFTGCRVDPAEDSSIPPISAEQEPSIEQDVPTVQKVAMITDFADIDDQGYNQSCWEGVRSWCNAMDMEYAYYQPAEDSTDARVLSVDQAVEEGANVIVLPGYIFGSLLFEIQETYPDIYFIAVDVGSGDMTCDYVTYYGPTDNTVCMTFAEEQAGYLAGYAAVKEGYTQLGFSGGAAIPPVARYGYGFIQGADAAASEMDVDICIKYSYEGQFCCDGYSELLGKMKQWEESGIEIIFPCGDKAPRYAKDLNAQIVAPDTDMSHISPTILTSAKKELKNSVEFALTGLYEGRWEAELGGQFINLTLQDGDFVGLPTTEEAFRFQNFTMEEYEAVKADIRNGIRIVSDAFEFLPAVSEHTVIEEVG